MRRIAAFCAVVALAALPLAAWAQRIESAPTNAAFLEDLKNVPLGQVPRFTASGYGLGLRPLPVDLSYLRGESAAPLAPLLAYPASYDLRSLGRLTAIRNQNPYGTCWSFGTYASMESCQLPGKTNNFSENNLVNLAGFDWGFNDGGNAFMSMAYLSRWSGPLWESDDGYPNPGGSPTNIPPRQHVQQVYMIPSKTSATANDYIKAAIMAYGAVYATYYHDDAYYNPATYSYYYSKVPNSPNHAVAIVGWDDNYDRTLFSSKPAGNGAYIVRNSWGTGWGDAGYFYVSYYDSKFARVDPMFVFLNAEPPGNYDAVYQYDPLGWVSSFGFGATTLWAANIYTAEAAETVQAIGCYAVQTNTAYEVYVYTNVTAGQPRSGGLASATLGTLANAGYRTISLPTPAQLSPGMRFSVVLKMTTPGYNYPQAYEYAVAGYSSRAASAPGQSYYSSSGSSWTDLTTYDSTANFCIKAFTSRQKTLTVISDYGGAFPGTLKTDSGTFISQYITNSPILLTSTQHVCAGGTVLSNSYVQVSATNITLTLTNNAILRWTWESSYRLLTATNGAGAVGPTGGWYAAGAEVMLTATAATNWHFTQWSGDTNGCWINGSAITVRMDRARSIVANFAQDNWTLDVASEFGFCEPPPGSHVYLASTNLACWITQSPLVLQDAQKTVSYICTGWIGTGSVPASGSTTNTGTFLLKSDSSITWLWVVTDVVLSNQTVTATTNIQARDTITAADGYRIRTPGSVDLKAGGSVRLSPGFMAETGSFFRARVVPAP